MVPTQSSTSSSILSMKLGPIKQGFGPQVSWTRTLTYIRVIPNNTLTFKSTSLCALSRLSWLGHTYTRKTICFPLVDTQLRVPTICQIVCTKRAPQSRVIGKTCMRWTTNLDIVPLRGLTHNLSDGCGKGVPNARTVTCTSYNL